MKSTKISEYKIPIPAQIIGFLLSENTNLT